MQQLPLFRLRKPKAQRSAKARAWAPVSWRHAIAALAPLLQIALRLAPRRKPQNRIKWTLDRSTLPYAVKPSKVIWMIQTAPPPKPMCFDDTKQWQEYLMGLHAEGTPITRRQDLGKHSGRRTVTTVFDRVDYCADCAIGGERQRRMQDEKRCLIPKAP